MSCNLHPTQKEHEKAVRPFGLEEKSAKVTFEDWDDYKKTMMSGLKEHHVAAVTKALHDIEDSSTGDNHMIKLVLGQKQDELTTFSLFAGLSDAVAERYSHARTLDPAQVNLLNAMSKLKRGFTLVRGAPGCGNTFMMLCMTGLLVKAGRKVLLLSQGNEQIEMLVDKLREYLTDLGLGADIAFFHKEKRVRSAEEVAKAQIVVGTPHAVNNRLIWTTFRPSIIFGDWFVLRTLHEQDILGVVAHFMATPGSTKITPFVQFASTLMSQLDKDFPEHPQLGLPLWHRMFLLGSDAYLLDHQHRMCGNIATILNDVFELDMKLL